MYGNIEIVEGYLSQIYSCGKQFNLLEEYSPLLAELDLTFPFNFSFIGIFVVMQGLRARLIADNNWLLRKGLEKVVYKCDQSSSVCSSKYGFVRHKCMTKKVESIQLSFSREGDNQVFKCTVCDKVVSSKTGLKRHMTMKHMNTNSQAMQPPSQVEKKATRSQSRNSQS